MKNEAAKKLSQKKSYKIFFVLFIFLASALFIIFKSRSDSNVKFSQQKQANIVNQLKKMRNNNFAAQDMARYYNKNRKGLNKDYRATSVLQIYRAVQNRDLYYNARASFLQGELNYARTMHPQVKNKPLENLKVLDNNIITGFIKETQNQFLKATYLGNDVIFLLPNYILLLKEFKKDANEETLDYFKLGKLIQTNQPISNDQVSITNIEKNFNSETTWLDNNPNSHYVKDVKTLMKYNYEILFGINNSFVFDNYKKHQYKSNYLKSLKTFKFKNPFLKSESQYLITHLKKSRILSNKDQNLYEAKAENLFSNDVFNSSKIELNPQGALNEGSKTK